MHSEKTLKTLRLRPRFQPSVHIWLPEELPKSENALKWVSQLSSAPVTTETASFMQYRIYLNDSRSFSCSVADQTKPGNCSNVAARRTDIKNMYNKLFPWCAARRKDRTELHQLFQCSDCCWLRSAATAGYYVWVRMAPPPHAVVSPVIAASTVIGTRWFDATVDQQLCGRRHYYLTGSEICARWGGEIHGWGGSTDGGSTTVCQEVQMPPPKSNIVDVGGSEGNCFPK